VKAAHSNQFVNWMQYSTHAVPAVAVHLFLGVLTLRNILVAHVWTEDVIGRAALFGVLSTSAGIQGKRRRFWILDDYLVPLHTP